jgi:hypothetical protein
VNLLMAHTHLDGAVLANSERQVHLGEDWPATPQALPDQAQYVALGHIHKLQRIEVSPAPTEYAGSTLQLDFGEAGQEKRFVVIDVNPAGPPRSRGYPTRGARRYSKECSPQRVLAENRYRDRFYEDRAGRARPSKPVLFRAKTCGIPQLRRRCAEHSAQEKIGRWGFNRAAAGPVAPRRSDSAESS